ncbi:hypothetical protein ACFW04_005452 [Cataglyphis niger]
MSLPPLAVTSLFSFVVYSSASKETPSNRFLNGSSKLCKIRYFHNFN